MHSKKTFLQNFLSINTAKIHPELKEQDYQPTQKVVKLNFIKQKILDIYENQNINTFIDFFNSFLCLYLAFFFIISTYEQILLQSIEFGVLNFLIYIYFLVELLLRMYGCNRARKHIYNLNEDILDLLTILPFLIIRFFIDGIFTETEYRLLSDISNLIALIRISKLEILLKYLDSEINKQLVSIILNMLTLVLLAASIFYVVEKYYDPINQSIEQNSIQFHYFVYFVMTTISTIGYGNYFTRSGTKVILITLTILSIIVNSTKISKLISLISSKSIYARRRYKFLQGVPYIILTGSISDFSAQDFFTEFFHEDHGTNPRHIVILMPQRPSSILESIILTSHFKNQIFYIQGDPLLDKDLRRCLIEKSKSIIIMCNKQSSDPQEEDSRTILLAMVIKKYLKQASVSIRLSMQILRPEGKTHYYLSINTQVKQDQVICIEEFKLSLLAKSCICPGLISFISNLISSSGEAPQISKQSNWIQEYFKGKKFEIYKTTLPHAFKGKKFSNIAAKIYKRFQAIMFAIEIKEDDESRVFPNPGNFILNDVLNVSVYIIAEDKQIADAIAQYKETSNYTSTTLANKTLVRLTTSFFGSNMNSKMKQIFEDDEDQIMTKQNKFNYLNSFIARELTGIEEKCIISPFKIQLNDVTYNTMENNILASNHIIVAGMMPNLINFIMPLRAKYLTEKKPIVILNESPPTDQQWNQICIFAEIYYVKGSALVLKDLFKANIKNASIVVVLSEHAVKQSILNKQ